MNRNEAFPSLSIQQLSPHLAWASLEIAGDDVEDVQLLVSGDEDDVTDLKVSLDKGSLILEQPAYGLTRKLNTVRWMQVLLRVPRSWKGAVDASTIAGPLKVRGLQCSDLALDTVSGDLRGVELRAISASARTVTGVMQLNGLAADKFSLRTVSGDVRTEAVSAREIHLNTISGNVCLEMSQPFERIEGSSVAGDVRVAAPMSEATISFRAAVGKLRTGGVSIVDDGPTVAVTSVSGNLYVNARGCGEDA